MKTLKNTILALLAVFAASCTSDDVENRPVVEGIDTPILQAPEEGNNYVLNPDNLDDLAERFVWTAANFGEGIIVNYDLEIDFSGEDFDTPSVIGSTNGVTQLAVSVNVLNSAIQTLEATPFEPSTFQVRVKAYVADNILYSNYVEITVTPFSTEIPKLWIPGGYQADSGYGDNWTHATAPMLSAVEFGDTNFEGYVYIANDITSPDNGFKFSAQAGWDGTNYGQGAGDGELSADGGASNLVANAGYYLVKANTEALTYSMTATQWGVIGNATPGGWDNSTPMTYDPETKKWSVIVEMTAQSAPDNGWKFRANNAWDINLGDTVANSTDGTLSYGGNNIGIAAAGTYLITLDLSNPRAYTYTIELQ